MLNRIKKNININQSKKFVIYSIGQLFNLLTPLLIVPIIVLKCGEENYGKAAVAMSVVFFIIVFVDFGSEISGLKQVSIERNNNLRLSELLSLNYKMKLIILLFFLILSFSVIYLLEFDYEFKKLLLLSLTIPIGQFINPGWFLQGIEDFRLLSLSNILSKTIYATSIFFYVQVEKDYLYINFWFGIGMIFAFTTVLYILLKKHKLKIINVKNELVFETIIKQKSIVLSQIFTWMQLYAPIIIISVFASKYIAGQFRVIDQIHSIYRTYIIMIFFFIYPKVCYDMSISQSKGIKKWLMFNMSNFVLVLFSLILVFIFSYEIIAYFNVTNRFLLSNVLQISLIYPLLFLISIALKQVMLALNHDKIYIRITIITVVFNLILLYYLSKYQGLFGVFYSLIFTEIITIVCFIFTLKKHIFINSLKKKN